MKDTTPPAPAPVARDAVLTLLAARPSAATVCPSEVARALAARMPAGAWRDMVPAIHAATDALLAEGRITLSWKGRPLVIRSGPYRISLTTVTPPPERG